MKFSATVEHVDPKLKVSRRHDAWLMRNDHPHYSSVALSFATGQLMSRDRVRKGTVSASSLDGCIRYQQFVYLGMPKLPPDPKNALKMHNGTMMHLRWQMAGLTEGWLEDAEVPVVHPLLKLQGTMDGLLYDGSILELKSINAAGFARVQQFGPLIPHTYQMATYMLCTRRTSGVFIYECKDNQEYLELVVDKAEMPLELAQGRALKVWELIDLKRLAEPLDKCLDQEGWVYRSCPFRDRCLGIMHWNEAI